MRPVRSSSCSSLGYALTEFDAAIRRDQTNHSIKTQPRLLNLYVASPEKVFDKGNLIGRIKMFIDRIWKWMTLNRYQGNIAEPVEVIIHCLFDQVMTAAYQCRQRHLAYQIQMIETHFALDQNDEKKEVIKARYFKHLERELQDANVSFLDLAARFDSSLFDRPVNSKDLDAMKNFVTKVSQMAFPFWHKMLYYQETYRGSLLRYLPEKFPSASPEKPISWAINEMQIYEAMWKEQKWIDLEGLIEQPIPFIELIKICQPHDQLDVREKKRLDKWITALNNHVAKAQENFEKTHQVVELVKNALVEIVNAVEIQGQLSMNVGVLISRLDDHGCKVMRLEDPRHRAWERELRKGNILKCKGKRYELGDELPSRKTTKNGIFKTLKIAKKDRYRVFKLENYPQLVIKMGKTPFDLSIDSYQFKEYHFGIPCVNGVQNIFETEEGYPFVLLEYLPRSLAGHHWTSSSFQLDPQDEEIASKITSFLFCMCDWHLWPNQISYDHLYFDSFNRIKITELLDCNDGSGFSEKECGPDNYLAAEEFCLTAAKANHQKANPHLLRYLMEVSGYSNHCMALFYREFVMTVLKTGDFNFLELSLPYSYNHSVYRNRVQQLFSQIKEIRATCLDLVTEFIESIPKEGKETFLKKTVKSFNGWRHFDKKKFSFMEGIQKADRELTKIQNEMEKRERSLKLLKNDLSVDNSKEIKAERSGYKSLIESQKKIMSDKQNRYEKLVEITVFDRLIDAYLDSSTPATISETLVETVLESFKNPIQIESDPVKNNNSAKIGFKIFKNLIGTVFDSLTNRGEVMNRARDSCEYYGAQQELIIAKNQYAINQILQI